jgi:HD-GYP domain-containing protein (c-di-GMP phosphodiesterase class II)
VEQVTAHLREVSGQHLDPVYVELLIANIDKAVDINKRWPD